MRTFWIVFNLWFLLCNTAGFARNDSTPFLVGAVANGLALVYWMHFSHLRCKPKHLIVDTPPKDAYSWSQK